MELPNIGEHCSEATCHQLDYLPMKCDACSKLFCSLHLKYDSHNCTSLYKKDVQVPVCPLCNAPVPTPRGTLPDMAVSAHIDQDCKSDKAKKKVFTNRCSKPKCKKKELVPVLCDSCKLNYCLTHRHPADHNCEGPKAVSSKAAAAASSRAAASAAASNRQNSNRSSAQSKITNFFTGPFRVDNPTQAPAAAASRSTAAPDRRPTATGARAAAGYVYSNSTRQVQGGMSEDEALAAALAASMQESSLEQRTPQSGATLSQEEEDRMLAQALAESEKTAPTRRQQEVGGDSKTCRLS